VVGGVPGGCPKRHPLRKPARVDTDNGVPLYDTPENDSREILTRGLIFELRRLSIGRKESANRGSANPNLFRNLPFGQTFTEEFLNLLQV
jgi:hypothetical protein